MLPKSHRLTEKRDFKRVITQGRSFFIKEFGLKYLDKKHDNKDNSRPTRIGIIVPKKITRTIVKRNRIKRQIRNIFLELIDKIKPGYDIVFFGRADLLKLKFEEMKKKVTNILSKIGLLIKQSND